MQPLKVGGKDNSAMISMCLCPTAQNGRKGKQRHDKENENVQNVTSGGDLAPRLRGGRPGGGTGISSSSSSSSSYDAEDRKSTRMNSSHMSTSYAVFCTK